MVDLLQVDTGYGFKLFTPKDDTIVTPGLANWQPAETKFILQHSYPGMTFYDIGANVGFYTRLLAERDVFVVAVEPDPQNYDLLWMNTLPLGGRCVELHQLALADYTGTATLYRSRENIGDHRIVASAEVLHWPQVEVDVEKGDNIFSGPVEMVKMDVQGSEDLVVAGMNRTLTTYKPILVFEFWPSVMDRPAWLIDRLRGDDPYYKLYTLLPSGKLFPLQDVSTGAIMMRASTSPGGFMTIVGMCS